MFIQKGWKTNTKDPDVVLIPNRCDHEFVHCEVSTLASFDCCGECHVGIIFVKLTHSDHRDFSYRNFFHRGYCGNGVSIALIPIVRPLHDLVPVDVIFASVRATYAQNEVSLVSLKVLFHPIVLARSVKHGLDRVLHHTCNKRSCQEVVMPVVATLEHVAVAVLSDKFMGLTQHGQLVHAIPVRWLQLSQVVPD